MKISNGRRVLRVTTFALMVLAGLCASTSGWALELTSGERISIQDGVATSMRSRSSETAASEVRLVFNKGTVFDVLNREVIPEMLPDLIDNAGLEGVIGLTSQELVKVENASYDSFHKEPSVYDEMDDYDAEEPCEMDMDSGMMECGGVTGSTLVEEWHELWNCDLEYTVSLMNPALTFDAEGADLDLNPSSGNDTLSVSVSLPRSRLNGDLYIYAKCNWLTIFDETVPVTVKGMSADLDVEMDLETPTVPRIKNIKNVEFALQSVEVDAEKLAWIQETIVEYALEQYAEAECESGEDFAGCISRVASRTLSGGGATDALETLVNDAVAEALPKVLTLEEDATLGDYAVHAGLDLTALSFDSGSPYIDTAWQGDFEISFTEDSCAAAVPELSDAVLPLTDYPSGGGEADLAMPLTLPKALMHAFAKAGNLCFTMTYVDAASGATFEGPLVPNGEITLTAGEYDVTVMTWDNYDSFFGDWDPENRHEEDGPSGASGMDVGIGTGNVGMLLPSEATGGGGVAVKKNSTAATAPNVTLAGLSQIGVTANASVSGVGGTDAMGSVAAVRAMPATVKPGYVLTVDTETESGLQFDIPVTYMAQKDVFGAAFTIAMESTLHIVGNFVATENRLTFQIKAAWVDAFSGAPDHGGTVQSLPDLDDQVNDQLAEIYYAKRIEYVTYYDCVADNDPDTVLLTTYGVDVDAEDSDCEDKCEIPTGLKTTALSGYGYELVVNDVLLEGEAMTIAMGTEDEISEGGSICVETAPAKRWESQMALNMQRSSEISRLVMERTVQEGVERIAQEKARLWQMGEAWESGIIFENPNPMPEEILLDVRADTFTRAVSPQNMRMNSNMTRFRP